MKDICPLEFQYQLTKSIWWWHNASAACKKMAEQTSKMMMTAPVSPARHKLPSHFTGNSRIIHPSVLTLSNQTIHLLRPVKQHLGNLTEGITMCWEYTKTLINIHQASHKKIIIQIQWRYSPTGPWPTERPPPVSKASANFCG
jgi:hypothetical protein